MGRMPAQSVDLVVTDPPYLVNYKDRQGRTVAGDSRTPALIYMAFAQVARLLKPDTFCVSFYGWHAVDHFMTAWKVLGLSPVGHLVWPKQYASGGGFVRYRHEQAYLLAKGRPAKPRFPLHDVRQWDYTGNTLHPTQKAVSVMRPLVTAFSKPGDIVLDPFAGSGSTALAAKESGRQFIGIEIDEAHAKYAKQRLADNQTKKHD